MRKSVESKSQITDDYVKQASQATQKKTISYHIVD